MSKPGKPKRERFAGAQVADVRTYEGRGQLVAELWESLAWVAYEGYLRSGRGAVYLSLEPAQVGYSPEGMIAAPGGQPVDAEIMGYLRDYDPENEAVICLKLPNGKLAFGRYEVDGQPAAQVWLRNQEPSANSTKGLKWQH
jgi:hypothetical protein